MIYEVASTYVGTPFAHLGRMPGVALDCVGCIVCSANTSGYKLKDFSVYGRDSDSVELKRRLNLDFNRIPVEEIKKDSILLFWIINRSIPQHLGIYDGYGNFIHAYCRNAKDQSKVVIQPLFPHWVKKVESAWDIKPELRY